MHQTKTNGKLEAGGGGAWLLQDLLVQPYSARGVIFTAETDNSSENAAEKSIFPS